VNPNSHPHILRAAFRAISFALILVSAQAQPALSPGRKYSTVERLKPERLAAVKAAREELAKSRKPPQEVGIYQDYRAVLHVHAEDADHTLGTRSEVLRAAKAAGVHVVAFSDHNGPKTDTWQGVRDGVMFFKGAENGGAHELTIPLPAPGLRFHSHVEEQLDAPSDGWDGMEIYNRHTDAEDDLDLIAWLKTAAADPLKLKEIASLAARFPDELFGAGADYWPAIMARWDKILEARRFPGIAANDSHQNQVLGKGASRIVLDPYEIAFRNVSTHILAREFTEAAIHDSLRQGRAYVSHDWLCDPAGFTFAAVNSLGVYQMGDGVPLAPGTRIVVRTPVPAVLKVIHQGKIVGETKGMELTVQAAAQGAYRAEAWLEIDGELRPWIYSNPIYTEPVGLAMLALPSQKLDEGVETVADLSYAEGPAADAEKYKLDIYRPKGASKRPVLVFLHGGAWVRGDRKQYPFFGNTFAKEGAVVVIPSYRLAPGHKFPAQAEDAAAALAWVVRNIGEYGGDPSRIVLAGHSAGGHLAALLTTNPKYLAAHELRPDAVRSVAALSGVYDLTGLEGRSQGRVFPQDETSLADASPVKHVKGATPAFHITYCQWDYASLPQQAQAFHAALVRAGAKPELLYIPGENHISEMISIVKAGDPTRTLLVRLVRPAGESIGR
jgi:acetyl esterase/lipase